MLPVRRNTAEKGSKIEKLINEITIAYNFNSKNMKKTHLIGIALLSLFTTGCSDNDDKEIIENTIVPNNINSCDSSNTIFNQLYNTAAGTVPNAEDVTMDTPLHSYTFEVTSAATICKIGYQSQPNFEAFPYLIEIINNTTGTTVYAANHTFSSASTEYVSITPVALNVGDSYTINRIQENWTNDITIYIGRLVYNTTGHAPLNFPYSSGILKITGSSLFAGDSDNYTLPYIDLVFE